MDEPGGLYIHIPFCTAKCHYCDFYSVAGREEMIGRLVSAIIAEIAATDPAQKPRKIDTIFIGGGTPSLLAPRQLEAILKAVGDHFDLDGRLELTIEANPGEIAPGSMEVWRSLGINRLSMGFQSFQPDLLRFLGRLHSPETSLAAFDAARRAGFDNINADLLFNVPGQSREQWQSDLAQLVALQPEHISAYSLTVESGTELDRRVRQGEVAMPPPETDREMLIQTWEYLGAQGYAGYEVSNYARPGRQCRHNLHYWRIDPYHGFGPAAHRFNGAVRSWNIRHLDGYVERLEMNRSPVAGRELLTEQENYNEKLAFGLRLREGISVTEALGFKDENAFAGHYAKLLDRWSDSVVLNQDNLSLTEAGLMMADAIAADFMALPPEDLIAVGARATGVA